MRTISMLAVLMLVSTSVWAQGTSGQFPDPMDYDDVRTLLAPLDLAREQQAALRGPHDAYLECLRVLREDRIARFLEQADPVPQAREERAAVEQRQRDRIAILRDMDGCERGFFDALRPLLTPDQSAGLERVAARRERERLRHDHGGGGWHLPSLANLDLARVIEQLDPSPEVRTAIDEAVAAYEQELTRAFRRIHEARLAGELERFDARKAARADMADRLRALAEEVDLQTEEGQAAMRDAVMQDMDMDMAGIMGRSAGTPSSQKVRDEMVRISRQNRQLLETIAPVMPEEFSRKLESRYFRRAYSMLRIPGDVLSRRVRPRLEDEATESDLRAAIEALWRDYLQDRGRGVRQLVIEAEKAGFETNSGAMVFLSGAQPAERDDPLAEGREALRELNERSLAAWAALTGEEVSEPGSRRIVFGGDGGDNEWVLDGAMLEGPVILSTVTADGDGDFAAAEVSIAFDAFEFAPLPAPGVVTEIVVGEPTDASTISVDDGGGEYVVSWGGGRPRWLPGPIDRELLEMIADRLRIAPSARPVLDELHRVYREGYGVLDGEVIQPAEKAARMLQRMGASAPDEAGISTAIADVRAAMAAVSAADDAFFADVAVLTDGGDAARATLARLREFRRRAAHDRRGGAGMFTMMGSGAREHAVDLTVVVSGADLPADDGDAAWTALEPYDQAAVGLVVDQWESRLRQAAEQARAMARMRAAEASGDFSALPDMNFMSSGQDAANRELARAALNRQGLEALAGALTPEAFRTVEANYRRAAFPNVYRDGSALDGVFGRLAELDVDANRRGELGALAAEYRAAYDDCCERMVQAARAFEKTRAAEESRDGTAPANHFMAMHGRHQELQQTLEQIRFERRNLNQQTRARLGELLSPEQRAQVGLTSDEE